MSNLGKQLVLSLKKELANSKVKKAFLGVQLFWLEVQDKALIPARIVITWLKNVTSYVIYMSKNKDNNWGYAYLERLIAWKLRRMIAHFERHGSLMCNNRRIKQMKYAVLLIERLHNDYYEDLWLAEHEQKWGKCEDVVEGKNNEWKIRYKKAKTPAEQAQAWEESKKIYRKAAQKEIELRQRLYKHIGTYITGWWD